MIPDNKMASVTVTFVVALTFEGVLLPVVRRMDVNGPSKIWIFNYTGLRVNPESSDPYSSV